jgi:hypothetical protein
MRKVASWIVLLIALFPLLLVSLRLFGMWSSSYLILIMLAYAVTVIGLWLAAGRVTARGWLVAGLLILAGLFVPTTLLMEDSGSPLSLGETILKIAIFLWPSIALIMAAVLLYSGFKLLAVETNPATAEGAGSPAAQKNTGRLAVACFTVSGLLILKTLHNLYWLTAWDATYDPLGYIWIIVPVLVAAFSGVLLLINLSRRTVWAGLGYLVLVPGLLIVVSTFAQRVDFRQLTEAFAGQVGQRVEAYYAREGRYPQDLRQVRPWFAASLPVPFIMYGQEWCYQAGEDYYQLGYVYREHWSSPELIRRVYKTAGEPPDPEAICAEEVEALIQREPFFYEK